MPRLGRGAYAGDGAGARDAFSRSRNFQKLRGGRWSGLVTAGSVGVTGVTGGRWVHAGFSCVARACHALMQG